MSNLQRLAFYLLRARLIAEFARVRAARRVVH